MASELEVTTIRGLSSGANANQILIPSGQSLHAPGHIVQVVTNVPTSVSLITQNNITPPTMAEVSSDYRTGITPKFSTSKLILECNFLFGGNNTSQISQFKFFNVTANSNIMSFTGATEGVRTMNHASTRHVDYDANDRDTIHMKTVIGAASTAFRQYTLYAGKETNGTR